MQSRLFAGPRRSWRRVSRFSPGFFRPAVWPRTLVRCASYSAEVVTIREPQPPAPDECCLSGCSECVWDVYEAQLQKYHDAEQRLSTPFEPTVEVTLVDTSAAPVSLAYPDRISEALEILQELPLLLGHASAENVVGIKKAVICSSVDVRQPHPSHDVQRFVRDIVIDVDPADRPLEYRPADHAAIYSPNTPEMVSRCLSRIVPRIDPSHAISTQVTLSKRNHDVANAHETVSAATELGEYIAQGDGERPELSASIDGLLRWGCDLHRTVSQNTLRILSQYAADEHERDELMRFAKDGAAFVEEVQSHFLNLVHVLENYRSVRISLDVLLQLACPALPRKYTITTSKSAQGHESFGILVSGNTEYGKCSSHFITGNATACDASSPEDHHALQVGRTPPFLFFQHFESEFPKPSLNDAPRIYFAAGTGVAPFLSMLREYEHLLREEIRNTTPGAPPPKPPHVTAIFGFRNPDYDFIFRDEFEKWTKTIPGAGGPILSLFHPIFSAAPNEPPFQDCYHVQDTIVQCPELFADRLFRHNDATVMVCGPKSLGASVQELLPKAAKVARPEWKPHQRNQYVQRMIDQGKFFQEVWG